MVVAKKEIFPFTAEGVIFSIHVMRGRSEINQYRRNAC